jgi:ribulose-bisphosphate carboxylase large chain
MLTCTFRLHPKDAARQIAEESSIGTWTDVPDTKKYLMPKIRKGRYVKISYPLELFEKRNVPQLMSSVAGNIFGMKAVKSLRLEDIEFPKSYIRSFKGPRYGIKGVRKKLRIKDRPLVGTIVKPKLGLTSREHAKRAEQAWLGGCDIVKDDENLTNQKFNPFKKRVRLTLRARNQAEKKTGERKAYMINITAETNKMLKRAKYVEEQGGRYVMVDVLTVGWSALQTLRNSTKLIIHAHRAGHAALDRGPFGISMLVIAKLCRLIGVDQVHIGTTELGKMAGKKDEVLEIEEEIVENSIKPHEQILRQKWYGVKPVFPVASGGLHPGLIPELVKRMGKDIIIQAGGGVHSHPDGTLAGARAICQALDATMQGIPLKEYAKTNEELNKAIKKWDSI